MSLPRAEEMSEAVAVTRFWRNIIQKGPDECWEWTGYRDRNEYGLFFFRGRMRPAHELALSFTTGEVRHRSLDTCHSCDNPPCCNPGHLRFDTRRSNVQDMLDRGRHKPRAMKLTTDMVRLMRERRANGASQQELADQFGVSRGEVSMITRGLRWRSAGGPIQVSQRLGNRGA